MSDELRAFHSIARLTQTSGQHTPGKASDGPDLNHAQHEMVMELRRVEPGAGIPRSGKTTGARYEGAGTKFIEGATEEADNGTVEAHRHRGGARAYNVAPRVEAVCKM